MDTVIDIINSNWFWFGPLAVCVLLVTLVHVVKDIFAAD